MDSRWLGVIVLIIIVALGGWYVFTNPTTSQVPVTETIPPPEEVTTTTANMPPAPVTVTYIDTGFSPSSVTVSEGQGVTWTNQSSRTMWVASAMHPAHTIYDGTNKDTHCAAGYAGEAPFDQCVAVPAEGSYTLTFTKAGDWKYHNHTNATDFGSVVVTAAQAVEGTSPTTTTVDVQ